MESTHQTEVKGDCMLKSNTFDPFESLKKIVTGIMYLYTHMDQKGVLKLRQSMDVFLAKMEKDCSVETTNQMVYEIMKKREVEKLG